MKRRVYTLLPPSGPPTQFALYENHHVRILPARDVRLSEQVDLIAFVPGTDVLLTEMTLPQRPASELPRLALYALEDDLAQSVESLEATIGPQREDGTRAVLVVDVSTREGWEHTLRSAGIKQAQLVPDICVLPEDPYAVDAGDRILLSLPGKRIAVDASLPDDALMALTAATDMPLKVIGDNLHDRLHRPSKAAKPVPLLACLAAWASEIDTLPDLCGGHFAPRVKAPIHLRAMRSSLIAASVCVSLLGAQKALELHSLTQLKSALTAEAQAAWASANPSAPPPTDIAAALSKQIQAPETPQLNFLDAASHLYTALPASGEVSIESLRYDGSQSQLTANLSYPSHGGDIDLKRELEAAGVPVVIGDSRQIEGRVLSTLVVGYTDD